MLVSKGLIAAALGQLLTIMGAIVVLHPRGSERFIGMGIATVVVFAIVIHAILRPRPSRPLTWAGAMFGAVMLVAMVILVFGFLPHEWLTYADSELNWGRRDNLAISTDIFDISFQAIRDLIEQNLYLANFAAVCGAWLLWQNRHRLAEERLAKQQAAPTSEPAGTSAYNRPVSKID